MSDKFVWEPWVEFDKDAPVLDIKEPPCPHCKFWKPQPVYIWVQHQGMTFDGVRLCHVEEMWEDFSCFKPNENSENEPVKVLP